MSATLSRHLNKRVDTGTISAITIGASFVSITIICLVCSIVWPRWRSLHPPTPSRKSWDESSILTRRGRLKHFPSHPAIRPLLSKPSATQLLPTYNPRTESPFPDSPGPFARSFIDAPERAASVPSMPSYSSSNGLFTPVRRINCERKTPTNHFHTVPRAVESRCIAGTSNEFGDAREFILAVPEPLVLKPRSAGRPPAVTRHLEKYGTLYMASPAGSDKLLHPKKLFQALQQSNQRASLCSSTSLKVDHRVSDAALAAKEVNEALNQAIDEDVERKGVRYSSEERKPNSSHRRGKDTVKDNLATIHRLRSYNSLTSSGTQQPARTGTIMRLKTPILELSRLYVSDSSQANSFPVVQIPKVETGTNLITDLGTSSDIEALSTPATSPILPPTCVLPFGASIEGQPRRIMTEIPRASRMPLVNQGQLRIRVRASSMYSRDTHGYSLTTTPTTLNFPSPLVDTFTGHEAGGNPFRTRESVKDRVNQWNQRLGHENTPAISLSPVLCANHTSMTQLEAEEGGTRAVEQVHVAVTENVLGTEFSPSESSSSAPGGAVWI